MPLNVALTTGAFRDMYKMVAPRPDNMPHITPVRLALPQKIPITMPGKKAEAAKEKEADTKANISAGFHDATKAATMATANKANLDNITRSSWECGLTEGSRLCPARISCTKALPMVSNKHRPLTKPLPSLPQRPSQK